MSIIKKNSKMPPQAIDFEEAVLGAIMIDKNAIAEVGDILSSDVFYKDSHKEIYKVIEKLFQDGQPIDTLMISEKLQKNKKLKFCGGDHYLVELTQKVISSANIEYHSRIIVQKHIQRELITTCSSIINDAFDESTDAIELLDKVESQIFAISEGNIKKKYLTASKLIQNAIKEIERIGNLEAGVSGIPSGFDEIDNVTSGWQNSELIIIAARPGMGKTAFVLSMARNIAVDHQIPVAVFSLEMSSLQLITRLMTAETGLNQQKLRTGDLDKWEWEILHNKIKNIEKADIYIDDTPALSVFDLRAKCRRLQSEHGIKLIIVDYLQLMTTRDKKGNREQEISHISRSLKGIAKELNVPVIALSQLSRAVETRGGNDKRPVLSDLRESGAIEQDADIVSFIYRPEYYGITEWDLTPTGPTEGEAEFLIAKHRNGPTHRSRLRFESKLIKFSNLDDQLYSTQYDSKINTENPFTSNENTSDEGENM
tara:strand:- start:242 stop:1690 length:1449 start_codon:yes stop_codon:yes gene_type:complete